VTVGDLAAPIQNAIVDGPFGSDLKVSDYVDDGVPVLQGRNITDDTFNLSGIRYITPQKAASLARAAVRVGDILTVKKGSIGYSAFVDDLGDADSAIIPTNLIKITPDTRLVETRYLHKWLVTPGVKRLLVGSASATTQAALTLAKVKSVPVPLPPLPEQRRIAAILDQADALRAKRRAAIAQLDTLAQAIFLDMFGDLASSAEGWTNSRNLGDVAEIVSGVTKGRKLNGQATRKMPYLAVVNVQDRRLDLSFLKTIEATEEEIRRYRLERHDLLLTEGGDPDKLGRGTLWNDELPECIHQNHIFRVRLTGGEITPVFLNWLVGSKYGKRYFLRSAKQTTGIATINSTQLRSFPLVLPPLSLQGQFEDRIARVEELKAGHLRSLARLDELFASLQHRAFRGEL
jgi:type I restriction enzyme S subunit